MDGFSILRRLVVMASVLALGVALLVPSVAVGKSTGGCPPGAGKWELVTVGSLGITDEEASGIASLDGNGDGMTCIMPLADGSLVFRDNTVRASS